MTASGGPIVLMLVTAKCITGLSVLESVDTRLGFKQRTADWSKEHPEDISRNGGLSLVPIKDHL